ncbi:MAG: hypothetical protein PHD76_03660 [Methylacidiphilales bacterium]|nr:hypothetical protein [Candidatus Methylacidiphilales bacterium]
MKHFTGGFSSFKRESGQLSAFSSQPSTEKAASCRRSPKIRFYLRYQRLKMDSADKAAGQDARQSGRDARAPVKPKFLPAFDHAGHSSSQVRSTQFVLTSIFAYFALFSG